MGYDDIDDSFTRKTTPPPLHRVANESQGTPGPSADPRPSGRVYQPALRGRTYKGLLLASPWRRYASAFFTYGPAWVGWVASMAIARHAQGDSVGASLLTILSFLVNLGSWAWYVFTMQHEGWQTPGGALMKTRVVWIRRDDDGQTRVYYPVRSQLIVRMLVALFFDSWLGWLAILLSRTNRSLGDLVAGTVVIVEGQIVPNLPYAKARGKKD